jgi:nucleotide-binding universal stress UspA family protein
MFPNILLAFDGSEASRKAAKLTGDLARQQGTATVWIVVVAEPVSGNLGEPNLTQTIEARKVAAQAFVDDAKSLIGDQISTQQEILFGPVAESIVTVAQTRHGDLIVIGSRGTRPLRALLLGNQTQQVLTLAECPVLVVK